MNTRTRREVRAWGKALGFLALTLATLAFLVLAGAYTTTL